MKKYWRQIVIIRLKWGRGKYDPILETNYCIQFLARGKTDFQGIGQQIFFNF